MNCVLITDKKEDGSYYNLNGVVIEEPVKRGIYIHNRHTILK
ncbi:MAG: hypothetical protein RR386_07535 [Bacteroidaceae bacterium]